MFNDITESRPPDFTNEHGVQWWIDKEMLKYLTEPNEHGTQIEDIVPYVVRAEDGVKERLLVREGEIIYHTQSFEALAAKIDMLKLAKQFTNGAGND